MGTKLILTALLFLLGAFQTQAQLIERNTELQTLSTELRQAQQSDKEYAIQRADSLGIPVRMELEDGTIMELMRFRNGWPVYYSTANAGGAALLNTNEVYASGAAGLDLSGDEQTIGLWDAGVPLLTHEQLNGRVNVEDGTSNEIDHATRVAGTLIASGINNTDAKGMAFEGEVNSYNWDSDTAKMSLAAADETNPLLLSVHPYQTSAGWTFGNISAKGEGWYWQGDQSQEGDESFHFGYYSDETRQWDEIAHLAPYYTIVTAAGNHRGRIYPDGTEESEIFIFYNLNGDLDWHSVEDILQVDGDFEIPGPDGGDDGYKSIAGFNLAKNILSVGAVNESLGMYTNSSWGPTDDGRIKPDVVAKGVSVFSTSAGSTTSYSTGSGTSFSAPMIAGSAALLLEHQENLHPGTLLRSSTIRGLIIHTAEDLGNPGPDYSNGWGLMNTQKAARVMSDNTEHGLHIHELTLDEGEEIFINVKTIGNEPLRATLAWTDPPVDESAIIEFGTLNDATPMLVNDLDLRIFNSNPTGYKPFILDPANPENVAITGDNTRDNVEMVHIESPAPGETYTIRVTHKNSLEEGYQNFSLIVTGNEAEQFALEIEEGEGEGWRFLSTPTATTYAEFLDPIWTQGPINSKFVSESVTSNVLIYDGSDYSAPEDLDTPLLPGTGIAVFMYDDDNLDGNSEWPKNLSANGLESISPFHLNTENGLNTGNNNFSLLGNPFYSAISFGDFIKEDIGDVVYVYDHACDSELELDEGGGDAGGCFRAWNGVGAGSLDGGRIAPFQGFFVLATGDNPEITIPEAAKTDTETPFYKSPDPSPVVQLQAVVNNRYHADTWFSFSETGSTEKNSHDAPYLYPLDFAPFTSFHSTFDDQAYHIKNLPNAFNEPLRIPLEITGWQTNGGESNPAYIPMDGMAEIRWNKIDTLPAEWSLLLEDTNTGSIISLRDHNSYSFHTQTEQAKSNVLPYKMDLVSAKASSGSTPRFILHVYPFQSVDPGVNHLPTEITLSQNYPNPFNPSTTIRYELPEATDVTLEVYSITGQKVATLANGIQAAGYHNVSFDAGNLASGVYLYRLTAGNTVKTNQMVLVK